MLLAVLALASLGHQTQTPPGWVEQKIAGGVTVSSPRILKKTPVTPQTKGAGDIWDDRTDAVHYGIQIDPAYPKKDATANEVLTDFCQEVSDSTDGTVDGEKDLLCQGWRGMAITFTDKDHRTIATRGYYYQGRIVEIYVSFDARSKRPESVELFLNSLRFAANGTEASSDPVLTQYPVGDTGILAGFPSKPESDQKSKTKDKDDAPSFSSPYGTLMLSVTCFPALVNREELSPSEFKELASTNIDGFLADPKAKTVSQHEITVDGEPGLFRSFITSQGEAGAITEVRHGKYIVFIGAVGPKAYDDQATIDAFIKSVHFTDKSSAANKGPIPWIEQSFADGVGVSVMRRLAKNPPDKDSEVANAIQTWSDESEDVSYQFQIIKSKDTVGKSAGILLSSVVQGMVGEAKGTIDGEKDLLLQGWPGIAVTIVIKEGVTMAARSYVYDDEVISLLAAYPTAIGRPPAVDKYLDSLRFQKAGSGTSTGPQMTLYPLGGSGISAIFPMKPAERDKPLPAGNALKGQKLHIYAGLYCGRVYALWYTDFPSQTPDPTPRDRTDFFNDALDQVEQEIKAKVTKQSEIKFGDETGLYREFTTSDGVGSEAVFYHKKKAVMLTVYGPKAYRESASIEAFYKSIQFKD